MQHQARILIALWIAAGCTYKEYNTYEVLGGEDAGPREVVGQGGAAGAGQGGTGGAAGTAGGAGSSAGSAGSAGSSGIEPGADCTGCARISVLSSRVAEYQLEFDSRRNLSNSLLLWRVRVRDYVDNVQVMAYVESGDHIGPEGGYTQEGAFSYVIMNASSGWQDVGIDLGTFQAFRAPSIQDVDGGGAGAGFDPGNPFDKSRVERVGLRIQPLSPSGVFTPATVELDAVTFSAPQDLSADFSADQAGFELVDPEAATISLVAQ